MVTLFIVIYVPSLSIMYDCHRLDRRSRNHPVAGEMLALHFRIRKGKRFLTCTQKGNFIQTGGDSSL